jgi:hypothetical protein
MGCIDFVMSMPDLDEFGFYLLMKSSEDFFSY